MAIRCPHNCGASFNEDKARLQFGQVGIAGDTAWDMEMWQCPECRGLTIELAQRRSSRSGHEPLPAQDWKRRIFPRSSRAAASEVPAAFRTDFEEAATILDLSAQASAALSRRCLQHVLKDHLGATGRDLEKQIDSVVDRLPSHIAGALHGLRQLGNFAAHPTKSTSTGEVLPVEPGEAEWTLDVLESLFDHVFVAPAKQRERLEALNAKLKDAGKPEIQMTDLATETDDD